MLRLKRQILVAVVLLLAALPACAPGQAAQPTATPVDLNAVMTAAAATAYVQLTQIAAVATPTLEPTLAPTEAQAAAGPTQEQSSPLLATATTAGVPLETPVVQPTQPLAETPVVPGITPLPTFTLQPTLRPTTSGDLCLNSAFVADVTIPDGTTFKPWEKFYKVWRVQNTGTCAWDGGFGFVSWSAGPPSMGGQTYFSDGERVEAGGVVDIGVDMYAPGEPGDYVMHWVMVDDKGKSFGGDFVVSIKVVK